MATLNLRTANDLAYLIPPKWLRKVRQDAIQAEEFSKVSGKEGTRSMIIENNDFTKEPGDTLSISVESELYGAGKSGEDTLAGNEEKAQLNQFTIQVNLYRHAEALTRKANKIAMIKEIVKAGGRLSRWMGVLRDDMVMNEMLSPAGATAKIIYAGAATSQATLSTSCRFSLDFIDRCKTALVRKGSMPIEITDSRTGEQLKKYVAYLDEISALRMFSSTDFRAAVQAMLPRSFNHPLITGALGEWNNVILRTYGSISQGCVQGTPLRPECAAEAGAATLDNTASRTILCVGADDGRVYTKNFPDSGKLNINRSGTQTEYTYTSKTDYTFVLSGTLGSDVADNDLVTVENDMAEVIFSGAEALGRCWAERDSEITQVEDYGMELGVGLECMVGQSVIEDSSGAPANYLIGRVMADSPNFQI